MIALSMVLSALLPADTVIRVPELVADFPVILTEAGMPTPPGEGHWISDLLRHSGGYIVYLTEHGPATPPGPSRTREQVTEDPRFRSLFFAVVDRYLESRGGNLAGYEESEARVVPLSEVRRVAGRFFHPVSIEPGGRVAAQVCGSINGWSESDEPRDIHLEALAYTSLMRPGKLAPMLPELKTAVAEVRLAEGAIDSERADDLLGRIQVRVWERMEQSDQLAQLLWDESQLLRDRLPFEVVDDRRGMVWDK